MIAPTIAPISSNRSAPTGGAWTITYFRSGWAFLIPYLAVYLLYAWLRWPANLVDGGQWTVIPCLLHVYWVLHAIHLVLGAIALCAWWKHGSKEQGILRPSSDLARCAGQVSGDRLLSTAYRLLPWLCLGLLFYIPGVYLEFPADPWHHFTKINEWSWVQTVTAHSTWKKSSYFLAYSFIGKITPPALQLRWFDVYYTCCCLLLCWQYFRLARVIGLSERASFVLILLNTLTFGNNLFGFYRYYGMSSTLFAQLGAVALTRIALEAMRGKLEPRVRIQAASALQSLLIHLSQAGFPVSRLRPLAISRRRHLPAAANCFQSRPRTRHRRIGHRCLVVWRLTEWQRSMIGWLALAAVALSVATILWYPRQPALDNLYRPQGWLTAWYGFNLFQPSSPAFDRAAAIMGLSGLVNIVAGFFLFRRNHIVGWLTLMPIIALSLPFIAIPIASTLAVAAALSGDYIIVYNRMLLAIPAGLALVVLLQNKKSGGWYHSPAIFILLLAGLVALMTVPAGSRSFNRLYNVLMVPPADSAMRHIIQSREAVPPEGKMLPNEASEQLSQMLIERYGVLTTPGIGYVLNSTGSTLIANTRLWMNWPKVDYPAANTTMLLELLPMINQAYIHEAPYWSVPALFSPKSVTGYLSNHWPANEVAFEHATQRELFLTHPRTAAPKHAPQIWLEWLKPITNEHYWGKGAGLPVNSVTMDDRGSVGNAAGPFVILSGDTLILRPVMRALDGNGWRVAIAVQGPGHFSQAGFTVPPCILTETVHRQTVYRSPCPPSEHRPPATVNC